MTHFLCIQMPTLLLYKLSKQNLVRWISFTYLGMSIWKLVCSFCGCHGKILWPEQHLHFSDYLLETWCACSAISVEMRDMIFMHPIPHFGSFTVCHRKIWWCTLLPHFKDFLIWNLVCSITSKCRLPDTLYLSPFPLSWRYCKAISHIQWWL